MLVVYLWSLNDLFHKHNLPLRGCNLRTNCNEIGAAPAIRLAPILQPAVGFDTYPCSVHVCAEGDAATLLTESPYTCLVVDVRTSIHAIVRRICHYPGDICYHSSLCGWLAIPEIYTAVLYKGVTSNRNVVFVAVGGTIECQ